MKGFTLRTLSIVAALLMAEPASATGWFHCGNLSQVGWSCQLASYPSGGYEYGIAYNTSEPLPVTCSYWNYGMRIYNKAPYFVQSDTPSSGMLWGGFVFYTGTLSSDDDTCSGGSWRHSYWHLSQNNLVTLPGGNGCHSTQPIYCRAR